MVYSYLQLRHSNVDLSGDIKLIFAQLQSTHVRNIHGTVAIVINTCIGQMGISFGQVLARSCLPDGRVPTNIFFKPTVYPPDFCHAPLKILLPIEGLDVYFFSNLAALWAIGLCYSATCKCEFIISPKIKYCPYPLYGLNNHFDKKKQICFTQNYTYKIYLVKLET
jgi:hypothetical protein